MKTHEFAQHLEMLARLLRNLPDTELGSNNFSEIKELLPRKVTSKKSVSRKKNFFVEDVTYRLSLMSPAEIEDYLLSEDSDFTVGDLSELANYIGITSSKRQSKIALVNMVTRHYEALKMHSIMRGTQDDEI
ncbi:hypothetical protein [Pseudomonas sp.]|uniref:hypothetical protein n=1 Tax=Pseudomonas sp. TaxID=306 RepID=UPI0028993914|nr:hypothetical protein [Pseudomonas sp.]